MLIAVRLWRAASDGKLNDWNRKIKYALCLSTFTVQKTKTEEMKMFASCYIAVLLCGLSSVLRSLHCSERSHGFVLSLQLDMHRIE